MYQQQIARELLDQFDHFGDKIAIISRERSVSYKALKQEVLAFSFYLEANIKEPEECMVIIGHKSIEMCVAILAVLSLGHAYIPIDPNWPESRVMQIILNSKTNSIIISGKKEGAKEWIRNIPQNTIFIEDIQKTQDDQLSCFEIQDVDSASPCYIMYTSGSTGQPKGVAMSIGSLIYFCNWAIKEFLLTEKDAVACVSPFTFDLSTFDVFVTLKCGAQLHLIDKSMAAFPTHFTKYMEEHYISVIYAVPTFLKIIETKGRLEERKLSSLRLVLFAGEVYPTGQFLKLRSKLQADVCYYNLYGPTETNVCTFYKIPDKIDVSESLPIGKALPGTDIFLQSSGDYENILTVKGPGVMIGYWGDEQIYGPDDAYITNDKVEVNQSGDFVFISRVDDIVKLWGNRVSLIEIENVLSNCPHITGVVAFCVKDDPIPFVKCVVLQNNEELDKGEITEAVIKYSADHLPAFMQPTQVEVVEEFPRTSTGKIDRNTIKNQFSRISPK